MKMPDTSDTSDETLYDEDCSSPAKPDKFDAVESIGSKRIFNVVNVFYIDRLRQRNFAAPPFFKEQLRDVLFEEGKVMKFRCCIGGVPLPEVEWYKGAVRIAQATESDDNLGDYIGYKYYASMENDNLFLIVTNVLPEDLGPYTCKIRNIVGEARCTAVLHAMPKRERRRPQKDSEGGMQKIVVEETITVVERKPLFTDAQSEFYMTPSSTTECEGATDKRQIKGNKQQDGNSEGVQPHEKLMTVMFAVPNACETRDLRIRISGPQPGFSSSENDVSFEHGFTEKSSDTDSSQFENSSSANRTTVKENFQLSSPGKEPTDANDLERHFSTSSEGEMHNREQWIQCGELSDSEYRRNSIPYPLPRCLTESTDDSIQPSSSQTTTNDVTTPDKNERRCSWQGKSEVDEERCEAESKDTVGAECGRLFAREVFQFPLFRGDFEDPSEFTDVFDDELMTSPMTEHQQETADICSEHDVATLHDFSPLSPDNGGLQVGEFEQDLVSIVSNEAFKSNPAECPGMETNHMTASFTVEEFVEPSNVEDQQSEPSTLFLSKSAGINNDENWESVDIPGDKNSVPISPPAPRYHSQGDSMKTLDELITRLLEFSENDYVLVSSLKIGRSAKKGNNSDTARVSTASHVASVDHRAIQASSFDDMYTEPYNVQQMSIPMHPSDLSAESEDEVEQHQPKFVIPLQDLVVDSEESIVLNISVTGFPAPQILWFKDGRPLNEVDTGEIIDDLKSQSATYTCVAKNPSGEAVTSANVTVRTNGAAGEPGITSAEAVEARNEVKLRHKNRIVTEEKRWSQIVSSSLVDYLRSKARSLQQAEDDASERDVKPTVTRMSEHAVGLTRDDVTLRRGSMLSLNSMSTTSYESADETLTSSDAVWEEVVSTCEEDFMSTDEFIFPGVEQNDLARLRLSGLYVGAKDDDDDDDDDLFSPRPLTPNPISEKPPFEYEITSTRSSRPFTRTATEPSLIVPDSSEDMETAPSNSATPVPPGDEESEQMLSEVDLRHPNFLVSLKDSDLVLGCTCALTCYVLGKPEPHVTWYRNGIRILPPGPNGRTSPRSFLTSFPAVESSSCTPSVRFKIISENKQDTLQNDKTIRYTAHTLMISDCRLTDAGEYSVTAVNSHGSDMSKASIGITKEGQTVSEDTIEFSAPRFLSKISDADGMLGGDATMTFELTGQPEPDVTIFHNKEEVEGERYSLTKDDEGRYALTISDLLLQDEGEVRVCAINVIGYAECASELFVDERTVTPTPDKYGIPQWSDHPEDFDFDVLDIREQLSSQSIAPYFDDIADDVTTEIGGEGTFAVRVYAWPAPDVYWYKDEERVLNAGRFSIECTDFGTHILKIRAINETDAGIYTCVAKNTIGEVSCKAELMLPSGNLSERSSDEESKETERRRFKDEYTICGNICSGSISVVRLVRHNETNGEYAAKYIRCVKVEWRDKFLNEVKILKKLSNNETIVEYKDYFETKKHIILVMKHAGREWFEYLLDRIDVTELEIASQVGGLCCGLQYLHENMIVHLDVKPENIMITEKTMKIVDFGNANELKEHEDVFWEYGIPEFVPPEIVESRPVTAASDMWSLGVVVFVALSGITPFSGESDYATIQQVRKGKFEFDNRWFAAVSEEAKDFIRKLLVLEPSLRMTAMEAQSHQWLQDNQSKESSNALSEGRLKYFCSRRKWQRSLVGPKTSLVMRSIPSLLRQEYDSASVAVPRSLIRDYTSSSTVTESEDETDSAIIDSAPTSPKFRFDMPRKFTHTATVERGRREPKSSITIEDTIELQREPVSTPTLKVTESSPKSSPVLKRKFVFGIQTNSDDEEQRKPEDSKKNDKRTNKPLRLSPLHAFNRLKIIGKKVSFDDDHANITEVEEVQSEVFVTASEQVASPPIVSEEVKLKEIPPVAQMPEVSKPATASGPPGIALDRPQSVSKLLKEDRKASKPRRTAETDGHMSTKQKIKKKLSLKNLRRHRSFDTRSLSSSSDDETVSRNGRQLMKKDSPAGKPKFFLFTRRKRSVTKESSIDSSSGQPEEKKTDTSAATHEQSHAPSKSPIKGILKRGASSDASPQSDPHLPKSLLKSRTPIAANQESFTCPRLYQKRPLAKGRSLDLDMVAEKSDSSHKDVKLTMKSSSGRRRLQFRRGSSVESALPTKPRQRVSGLRGPLLEKDTADDEPAAGMSLRRLTPVANKDVSLPNHSRSYSGPLSLPSPTFSTGRLSPTILSPRVPPSSPYHKYASLQRSFFSQSVDIAGAQLPDTVPENGFIGRKSQSAQLPTTGFLLPRSRSQDRPIGRRSRSSDRRSAGESYAPYLKAPLVDQGVTQNQMYATLSCLIDAFPQPEVTWRRDGLEVSAADRIEIISEPSISRYQLKIRNLALPADFGHYFCEARNAFGTVKTDCKLMQAISPEKPSAPEFSGTDGRNVWITWNPPGNCATSPMSYMLQYREMAAMKWVTVDDSIKDTLHKVENLRSTTSYRFRVRAVNNAGVGPFSKVSQRIQLDPKATIQTLKYAF